MKLLQVLPSVARGGVEEYAITIGSAAVSKGWDVHVAFPNRDSTSELRSDFAKAGITSHPLEIPPAGNSKIQILFQLLRTLFLLLKVKPDAVQINLPFPDQCVAIIMACALLKMPTMIVFHLVSDPIYLGKRRVNIFLWARGRSQHWVTISEDNRELLCKYLHVKKDEIKLVYNGAVFVNSDILPEEKGLIREKVRREIGVLPSDIMAVTVGRLHSQKGYDLSIPAIPYILKKHPNVRFVWVGEGEQREELEMLLTEYRISDRVLMLGYRRDIPQLLLAADLFLFPSRYEGFPIALLEAMAAGLPVVASSASGIPEVIEGDVHGILFRRLDSCALLAAMMSALDNPEEMRQMAERAKLRVKKFSTEKMTRTTLELLEKLIDEKL